MNRDLKSVFLKDTQSAYANMVAHEEQKKRETKAKETKDVKVQADDLISFRQFSKKSSGDADEVRSDRHLVVGDLLTLSPNSTILICLRLLALPTWLRTTSCPNSTRSSSLQVRFHFVDVLSCPLLNNVPPGFSDPVYAEAYVNVHQFDVNLGEHTLTSARINPC